MRSSRSRPLVSALVIAGAFGLFFLVRLLAWRYRYVIFGDAYNYYVPAGIYYIHGGLPQLGLSQTNPEHPPLAKYTIGFFAVYFHNPNLASLLFGFLLVLVVYLLSMKLLGTARWAALPVFLLAIDGINVNLTLDPMLDVFMIFFGVLGIYLLVADRGNWTVLAAGVSFGFAIACKWLGGLFLLAGVIWLLRTKRLRPVAIILTLALAAYLMTYVPFIITRGFGDFVSLQFWMLTYMAQKQIGTFGLITALNRVVGPYFFISRFNPLYDPFIRFGPYFVSVNNSADPLTALLPYPVLYLQLRRLTKSSMMQLILLTNGFFIVFHLVALDPFESWLFAPVTALTSIIAGSLMVETYHLRFRNERHCDDEDDNPYVKTEGVEALVEQAGAKMLSASSNGVRG